MQFIFYPSGYAGATDGFCSFFLYCPGGVTLRSWLCAGKQRREVHHSFREAGAYGRTNFCRYEGLADEDTDTLLLVLEVEDCRQELTSAVGEASAVKGEIKLARLPGKSALTDVKLLPSLWTSQGLGDMNKPPDGYHSFGALRSRTRSGTTALPAAPVDALEESQNRSGPSSTVVRTGEVPVRRSESMPVLRNSPTGDGSLPLLGRSPVAGSEDWSSSRARKPRVVKRPTAIVASPIHAASS